MKFIIIVCMLLMSSVSYASQQEGYSQQTMDYLAAVSAELKKEEDKHLARLVIINKEIEAAEKKLQEIKLKKALISKSQSIDLSWLHANIDTTKKCTVRLEYKLGFWRQAKKVTCKKHEPPYDIKNLLKGNKFRAYKK